MRATISAKAVRAIAPWASKNLSRGIITSVKIDLLPGAYRLVATDSHRLAVIEGKRQGDGVASLAIDARAFTDQLKASDDYLVIDTDTLMAYAGKRCETEPIEYLEQHKEDHRAIIKLRSVEGTFPEWQKLIPEKQEATTTEAVAVSPGDLEAVDKLAKTIAGRMRTSLHICLQGPTKPVLFWSDINHLQILARMVIMPIRDNNAVPTYC